jgi:hypothetical protein
LTLQFIGVPVITFFGTYFRRFFGRNGLQMPLVARYCVHVGEMRVLWGFARFFLVMGNNSGLRKNACTDCSKNGFKDISRTDFSGFSGGQQKVLG